MNSSIVNEHFFYWNKLQNSWSGAEIQGMVERNNNTVPQNSSIINKSQNCM